MTSRTDSPLGALRRPLEPGEPLLLWQVGETVESRYDVADAPMAGEMDPFFFLTGHKNFIPHEYPCRTAFAAEFRGRRPEPRGTFRPVRNVLPFGADRLDLSGFWFRPTRLSTFVRTVVVAQEAGQTTFELSTAGGAVLFVNGTERGFVAHYVRNLDTTTTLAAPLHAGENEVLVHLDDLAERDTRYGLRLVWRDGPAAEEALPVAGDPAIAAAVVAMLSDLRFERAACHGGEVALVTGRPLPVAAELAIAVTGDFISRERPTLVLAVAAGAGRIRLADADALPADYRHFEVALRADGFRAARVLGVEISHAGRQGDPPASLAARIAEALARVAEGGEADTVTALARFACGHAGAGTDAMIAEALAPIEDCHDCADFLLVPLLWARHAYGERMGAGLRERVDRAILAYRYWMDEPGNDVQWYFSENHALLFHTAATLAGALFPQDRFVRSGRTGAEQAAVGATRVRAWFDHFERWEMAEFNSAAYFPIDLTGLTALFALASDADIRDRAGRAIVRLMWIVARSSHHGIMTGAQGRSYEHTLQAARSLELSAIARLLWGVGGVYGRRFHAVPQLALCLRDHGLVVPEAEQRAVADWALADAQEWCFAQGQDRIAKLYHHKTVAAAMGSVAAYRWGQWGYQETVLQLRLGSNPDASIVVNHPGERVPSGHGRPSFWGGCGTIPRVQQYRGLAVLVFALAEEQADFTHAWFPAQAFDEHFVDVGTAAARSGGGAALLQAGAAFELVAAGPTAGSELRLPGRAATWLVRVGALAAGGSLADFGTRFGALRVVVAGGDLLVDDPEYGPVLFRADGTVAAEGRTLDPSQWSVEGEARIIPVRAFWG